MHGSRFNDYWVDKVQKSKKIGENVEDLKTEWYSYPRPLPLDSTFKYEEKTWSTWQSTVYFFILYEERQRLQTNIVGRCWANMQAVSYPFTKGDILVF